MAFGLSAGTIAALASAAAGVAGAGTSIASAAGAFGNKSQAPQAPRPQTQDPSQIARSFLPQVKADAAARSGGGLSPDFLASLVDQSTGAPGGGMGILDEIRKSLGQN